MSLDQTSARESVRRLIQDGQTADTTFNLARLESLSDQIADLATPTATQFLIHFEEVPYEQHVTVYAIPGTLVAYVDGSSSPTVPSVDVDLNGNFTLPVAPASSLEVTYGWQLFADSDIDSYVAQALGWLDGYADLTLVPASLTGALTKKASAVALRALARKFTLADLSAGDEKSALSSLAKAYQQQAKDLDAEALADRTAASQKPERLAPAVATVTLAIDPYQPKR